MRALGNAAVTGVRSEKMNFSPNAPGVPDQANIYPEGTQIAPAGELDVPWTAFRWQSMTH